MSASNQVNINLQSGYWLSWLVTAQCCYDQTLQLTDGNTSIFNVTKPTSSFDFQVLTETKTQNNLYQIQNNTLVLTISSNSTNAYVKYMYKYDIMDPDTGDTMGHVFDLFFEDDEIKTSSIDFNDVAIHLVAMRSHS